MGNKEPPQVITKESGQMVGDGGDGDAQLCSPPPPPPGLEVPTGLAKTQKFSCWAGRRN